MYTDINLGLFIIPIRFNNLSEYPTKYLLFCSEAEKHGYNEFYVGEHLTDKQEDIKSSILFCSAMSALLNKGTVAPCVLPLPYYKDKRLLVMQLIELARMNEGRIKVGIGPGAIDDDMRLLNLEPKNRSKIYENSIDEFMVCLGELWPSKLVKPEIFSTVLGPEPKKASMLKDKSIHIISSNFTDPKHFARQIECYESSDNSERGSWSVIVNYISPRASESTLTIAGKTIDYISAKLGSKSSEVMGYCHSKNEQNYSHLTCMCEPESILDEVSKYLPRKPQSLIINIFDALDDYQYREDLLKIAKTIRKV